VTEFVRREMEVKPDQSGHYGQANLTFEDGRNTRTACHTAGSSAAEGIAMESHPDLSKSEDESLVELLDRLLNEGVVVCGDLAISVADIELVYLRLQLALSSVETARQAGWYTPIRGPCPNEPRSQHA
jgi:hypothetical protein